MVVSLTYPRHGSRFFNKITTRIFRQFIRRNHGYSEIIQRKSEKKNTNKKLNKDDKMDKEC